jgi:hypothetical protein
MNAIIMASKAPILTVLLPTFGLSFCKKSVEVAATDEQLAVPHSQPDGQQLPPTEGSQVDQPVAQAPVGDVRVAAAPTGTTMVTPLLTIVVEDIAGQLKVSQLRPVWPREWNSQHFHI